MGESLKAILQLTLIVAVIVAIIAWFITRVPVEILWSLRIGGAGVSAVLGWLLFKNLGRKEILPDMLARVTPKYFERDGFCFTFVPGVGNGACWMQIFFQNRYEQPCVARVVLNPPKSFFLGREKTPGIDVEIACEGAAFGVYRAPWPISPAMQGKMAKCEVGCSTNYRGGRGKLMRFRAGLRCGSPGSAVGRAALTAGLLLVGVVRVSKPARFSLRMPTGVFSEPPPGINPLTEILWRPDLPTGGFPVIPVSTDPTQI